jgi:energy-coupling factor transporter ATP-binding protein EcfA2
VEEAQGFVGRVREIEDVTAALLAGKSVLIVGRTGIGKTALMRQVAASLAERPDKPVVWVPKDTTKQSFRALAQALHETHGLSLPADILPKQTLARAQRTGFLPWSDLTRPLWRLPTATVHSILLQTLRDHPTVVFLESLEVPPSQADFYRDLIEVCQVVAGMDANNYRSRIKKLVWKFGHRLELKPLPLEECRLIVEQQVQAQQVRFSTDRVRERFIQAAAQASGGVPEAILSIVEAAAAENEITPAKVHGFGHEAGKTYLDMTPFVLFGMLGFMVLRYLSKGLSEVEMTVIAGIGMTLFAAARMLMSRLAMRK